MKGKIYPRERHLNLLVCIACSSFVAPCLTGVISLACAATFYRLPLALLTSVTPLYRCCVIGSTCPKSQRKRGSASTKRRRQSLVARGAEEPARPRGCTSLEGCRGEMPRVQTGRGCARGCVPVPESNLNRRPLRGVLPGRKKSRQFISAVYGLRQLSICEYTE